MHGCPRYLFDVEVHICDLVNILFFSQLERLKTEEEEGAADFYWKYYSLALTRSGSSAVQVAALNGIYKLIIHGYLKGDKPYVEEEVLPTEEVEEDHHEEEIVMLSEQIVSEVLFCVDTSEDCDVQLQVLKVILSAVTSKDFQVHGQVLLHCVYMCFNLFLATEDDILAMTCKATLTQMLNFIFQKLEAKDAILSEASAIELQRKHEDAFIVFESLCKIASEFPDGDNDIGSKILALELIASVMFVHNHVYIC